mgnify:CR=1 FL=1
MQSRRRQLAVASASAQITTASAAAAPVRRADGSPLRVMIAGPPAAGKGTQCQRIVEKVRREGIESQNGF